MKQFLTIITFIIAPLFGGGWLFANTSQEAWKTEYPSIEANIKAPAFNKKEYNIVKFGAKPNDPKFLNSEAINKAIDKCSADGGGIVVIPAGVWHTGAITLKSNVNLCVSEGATLLFTTDTKQYPLALTRWEGIDCYNYQPMIYAYGQTNIAISGKGTIDGGATRADWWSMNGDPRYGWREGMDSQKTGKKGRELLLKWNENNTPVEERKMGDGYGMRPQLVNFYKCANVLIEDVTLLRSPFWVIHPLLCENLTVRRVHIQNDGPNGDGCDPESCKNVLIENCYFDTGDDCIAIKSGRNNDGRRWNIPSENIIVRNCYMKNGHGGVVVGSEISGGYKNLFVENCKMDSPELERVIRIKTNNCRGGIIENIHVRNIEVGECKEAVLRIEMTYEPNEKCRRDFPPVVRNIYLENITSKKSKYGVMITAADDDTNVYNIEVKNSSFQGVEKNGNYITGKIKNIRFANLYINKQLATDHQPWSQAMVMSEMKRTPRAWMLDFSNTPKWGYTIGLELESFWQVYKQYDSKKIAGYVLSYTDTIVKKDGTILSYKISDYNIDQINSGKLLLKVYDETKQDKYLKAIHTLYSQLENQPRTTEGGFWHKKVYPQQMWLDGLYMGSPFLAQYAAIQLNGSQSVFDDVANQFLIVARHTYDPNTGLYRHAWDETKSQIWADPVTGQSAHTWGRAQGWFFMALVDALDYIPENHPQRNDLLKLLQTIADGVIKTQQPDTGVWYQVMDQPQRKGNYLEATCSSMFSYALLKGARKGYLGEAYKQAGEKAFNGIITNFVQKNEDGTISLTRCCAVAGLGGKQQRNGSFEYYISEPIIDNDPKGVGPFIKAALEMERM